jgi:AhpD family alkylhydroperoxidase
MLAVSHENSCSACALVHERWALRTGVPAADLDLLRRAESARLDGANAVAVAYATDRARTRFAQPASAAATAALAEQLGHDAVAYVDAVARAMALANVTVNTLHAHRRRQRANHPIFARIWGLVGPRIVDSDQRAQLLAGLRGDVVEVGAGTGVNFRHYPLAVTSVLAVEPEPHLRMLAGRQAATSAVPVTVSDGTAETLPASDSSFDAAIASLVLCSVPEQHAALMELHRVLRPGGELRFYEHVVARQRLGATLQRALDRSRIWPTLGAGCHLARDTLGALGPAGFTIKHSRRTVRAGIPHVFGVAVRTD